MNTSYLIELSKNYIQRKNGDVYKVTPKHFLKISPWNDGEDRRIFEISEDDVPLIYGGPIYIKFISDANTDIICSIYDSEHLSFKQKDKTMYYRDSSGTLNNLLTYVNKAYYEIAERNNYEQN